MLGLKVRCLRVLPFGFSISFKIDLDNYNKKVLKANLLTVKNIIISLAGPLINLIFIIIFIIIDKDVIFGIEADILIYTNLLILVFNMLAIYPLDGGRILKDILYLFCGKIISLEITNILSIIVTSILTIFALALSIATKNILYIFTLTYIWVIAIRESKINNMKIKIYKILKNNIAINKD